MIEFSQPAALWTGLAIGLPILAHMAYQTVTRKHPFSLFVSFVQPVFPGRDEKLLGLVTAHSKNFTLRTVNNVACGSILEKW